MASVKKFPANVEGLPFPPTVFKEILGFVRLVLKNELTKATSPTDFVQSLGSSTDPTNALLQYRNMLEAGLSGKSTVEVVLVASSALLDLFSFFFQDMVSSYVDRIPILLPLLSRAKGDGLRVVAKIVGLVSPSLPAEGWTSLLNTLLANVRARNSFFVDCVA